MRLNKWWAVRKVADKCLSSGAVLAGGRQCRQVVVVAQMVLSGNVLEWGRLYLDVVCVCGRGGVVVVCMRRDGWSAEQVMGAGNGGRLVAAALSCVF